MLTMNAMTMKLWLKPDEAPDDLLALDLQLDQAGSTTTADLP